MNILDIIIGIPLIWMAYRGFNKGFVVEVSTLIALILGIYFAINFSFYTADLLRDYFTIDESYMAILSFVVTFIVVVIAINMVGKMIGKLIDMVSLGFLDQLAGGVFGILKAALIISAIILVINNVDRQQNLIKSELKAGSKLYHPVASLLPTILPMINFEGFDETIKENAGDLLPQDV